VDQEPAFLFITGGVISSLGKGLAASAIGLLLERQGYKVAMLKLDPYLNIDPGTMSPYQHGEVYVTDDGMEADLDLGHYFRFTNSPLSKTSTATAGQIYDDVLRRERRGEYLGNTVQVIPHVTDEIKLRLRACASQLQGFGFVIVEIGGTVGDIESQPFLEAIRQFRYEKHRHCLNIHLTYVPFVRSAGETKTKPTQHSVQALRQIGLFPDLILCRTENSLGEDERRKIKLFCNVADDAVYELPDVDLTYDVPMVLHRQNVEQSILQRVGREAKPVDLSDWYHDTRVTIPNPPVVRIGVVGKYVRHQDAYKSLYESLYHASCRVGCTLKVEKLDPEQVDHDGFPRSFRGLDGYLIPGGFGVRGWEGKIAAASYCRTEKVPYFGVCLGMQVLAVEFARHVLGYKNANSTEFDLDTENPIISLLSEQEHIENLGGTMRRGAYPCQITPGSLAAKAYHAQLIHERHRHRYEFNNRYRDEFENKGARLSGLSPDGSLCEIMEIVDHPWMVGVQFHPEFKSKPSAPHPLFVAFVQAATDFATSKKEKAK
jgi:CTP synthase